MSIWTSGASRITRSWVAVYTLGLASDYRRARLAEIASDVWEHQQDAASEGTRRRVGGGMYVPTQTLLAIALSIISRTVRGVPEDLLWRLRLEGPQMDIRIAPERIMGALLLGMVAMMLITSGISGIDTRATEFEPYLRDFAGRSAFSHNGNAFFRIATGFSLIAAGAGLYATLKDRSPVLAAIVGFGMLGAAALELVATGLQIVLIKLADEYVAAPAALQPELLTNARTIALLVETATGLALFTLLASVYTLAILTAIERLVPRWLIGLPILSAVTVGTAMFMSSAGIGDEASWLALIGGGLLGVIWLLIAGFWLMFTPKQPATAPGPLPAGA